MITPKKPLMPNIGTIARSQIAFYCLRKKVYDEVFSTHQLLSIQHNFDSNVLSYTCLIILPIVFLYLMQDIKSKKSFKVLKKYESKFSQFINFVIFVCFIMFVEDVDNAF